MSEGQALDKPDNTIRTTDDEELNGGYGSATGYRPGPEGCGPCGDTGFGLKTDHNPPKERVGSGSGQEQHVRTEQQTGFGSGQGDRKY